MAAFDEDRQKSKVSSKKKKFKFSKYARKIIEFISEIKHELPNNRRDSLRITSV